MRNLEELMTQGRLRRESRRDEFVRKSLLSDEFLDLVQKNKKPFDLMMSYYQCAIMEIETKFRVLDQEYSLEYDKNPIEAIKSRVKSPESLAKKIRRKNIPMSLTSHRKKRLYQKSQTKRIQKSSSDRAGSDFSAEKQKIRKCGSAVPHHCHGFLGKSGT